MGRKGKTQKHTAKEIAGKVQASKNMNGAAGHGAVGLQARKEQMNRVSVKCQVCMMEAPHLSGMKNHYESKHPKVNFDEAHYASQYESTKKNLVKSHTVLKKEEIPGKPAAAAKKKGDLGLLDGY